MSRKDIMDHKKLKAMFTGPCHLKQVRNAGFFSQSHQLLHYHLKDKLMSPIRYLHAINAFPEPITYKEMQDIAKLHDIDLNRHTAYLNWEIKSKYIDNFIERPGCEYITDYELSQRYGKYAWKYIKAAGWRLHEENQTWYQTKNS